MTRRIIIIIMALCSMTGAWADGGGNEARRTFEKVYNSVFGPQGCTLRYDVNLIGLYKSAGVIWYKGKKNRFSDARADSWCDGVTQYTVYRKKKIVEVNDVASGKGDKYGSKFKFTLDDFDYSMERTDEGIWFTLKQRREAKGTVKHVRALVDGRTLAPLKVKIKVAFFWANISISDFKSGGISDNIFVFPRSNYGSDYRYVDRR